MDLPKGKSWTNWKTRRWYRKTSCQKTDFDAYRSSNWIATRRNCVFKFKIKINESIFVVFNYFFISEYSAM